MKYLGGKARLARKFGAIIDEALRRGSGKLVEPFVGAFNLVPVLKNVASAECSDIHPALINLLISLQAGWIPPTSLTEEEYDALKAAGLNDAYTAFAAFGCSFGGKEWGGFARGKGRDYAAEAHRALIAKVPHMRNVRFTCHDYRQSAVQPGDVVYVDPPYLGTTGYRTGKFDHQEFYEWCESVAAMGAWVFVSEFTVPDRPHWNVVWATERSITVDRAEKMPRRRDYLIEVDV